MDVDRAFSSDEKKLLTPRGVRVAVLPYGLVSVSWTAPASERSVASYQVWSDAVKVADVPGTQTSKVIELGRSRTHYIQVQAVDTDGNTSELSRFGIVEAGSGSSRSGAWVAWVVGLLLLFGFGVITALAALGGAAFCSDNDAATQNCADAYRAGGVLGGVAIVTTAVIATALIVRAVKSRLHRRHAARTDWDAPS